MWCSLQIGDEIEYRAGAAIWGAGPGVRKTAQVIGFNDDGVILVKAGQRGALLPGLHPGAILAVKRQVNGQAREIYRRG